MVVVCTHDGGIILIQSDSNEGERREGRGRGLLNKKVRDQERYPSTPLGTVIGLSTVTYGGPSYHTETKTTRNTLLKGQSHRPFLYKPGPNLLHVFQQLRTFLLRLDIRRMQANTKVPDVVLNTSVVVPTEEIVDPFPSHQGSAGHQPVKGMDFDFLEVRGGYGEEGVPVLVVRFEVGQEVD